MREPASGSRRQGAGVRKPASGSLRQGASVRELCTRAEMRFVRPLSHFRGLVGDCQHRVHASEALPKLSSGNRALAPAWGTFLYIGKSDHLVSKVKIFIFYLSSAKHALEALRIATFQKSSSPLSAVQMFVSLHFSCKNRVRAACLRGFLEGTFQKSRSRLSAVHFVLAPPGSLSLLGSSWLLLAAPVRLFRVVYVPCRLEGAGVCGISPCPSSHRLAPKVRAMYPGCASEKECRIVLVQYWPS